MGEKGRGGRGSACLLLPPLMNAHKNVGLQKISMLTVLIQVYMMQTYIVFSRTEHLGHGKKIHCFSGKTFTTLEAVGRFFFFF